MIRIISISRFDGRRFIVVCDDLFVFSLFFANAIIEMLKMV